MGLNISLERKNKDIGFYLLFIGYFGIAYITIKPVSFESWVVTVIAMYPAVLFLAIGHSKLNYWAENHRYIVAGWVSMIIRFGVFLGVKIYLAPFLIKILVNIKNA